MDLGIAGAVNITTDGQIHISPKICGSAGMENVCDLSMKPDKRRHGPLNPAQKPSEEEEEFLRRQTGKKEATTLHRVTVSVCSTPTGHCC